MTLLALGSHRFGGFSVIPYGWDLLAVAVSSLGFYASGVRSGWFNEFVREALAHSQRSAALE